MIKFYGWISYKVVGPFAGLTKRLVFTRPKSIFINRKPYFLLQILSQRKVVRFQIFFSFSFAPKVGLFIKYVLFQVRSEYAAYVLVNTINIKANIFFGDLRAQNFFFVEMFLNFIAGIHGQFLGANKFWGLNINTKRFEALKLIQIIFGASKLNSTALSLSINEINANFRSLSFDQDTPPVTDFLDSLTSSNLS